MGNNQSVPQNVTDELVVHLKKVLDLLEQSPTNPCPMPDDNAIAEEVDKVDQEQREQAVREEQTQVYHAKVYNPANVPSGRTPNVQATGSRLPPPRGLDYVPPVQPLSGGAIHAQQINSHNEELKKRKENETRRNRDVIVPLRGMVAQNYIRRVAQEQIIGLDTVKKYNFAFAGAVGVGKSTLINSLRGIKDEDYPGYAPVGETECTMELASYKHPRCKNVVFWDFPGGGIPDRPRKGYFFEQKLYAFDHLIIVIAERITQLDFDIAQEARKYKVPFTFVRSKADLSIQSRRNQMRGSELADVKSSLRRVINEDFQKQCQAGYLADANNVYVVSEDGFNFGYPIADEYAMDEKTLLLYVAEMSVKRRS